MPFYNEFEGPEQAGMRTQFFPEQEENPLVNTQPYRFARASGASHEVALRNAEMAAQRDPRIATHRLPHAVQEISSGGAGGGGQMTLNGGQPPADGINPRLGVQPLLNRIDPNNQYQRSLQARQALAALNALQRNQDNRGMQQTERLINNPMSHFGRGGGDWASQFGRMTEPRPGIFGAIVGNQANLAAGGYGNQLNQTFNSPAGPYGQMQAAAAATAPARASRDIAAMQTAADRDIARMRFDTTRDLFGTLLGRMGGIGSPGQVSGIETDYGAFAKMKPASAKKYMPGGPAR